MSSQISPWADVLTNATLVKNTHMLKATAWIIADAVRLNSLTILLPVLNILYSVLWYGVRLRTPLLTIDPQTGLTVYEVQVQRITFPLCSYQRPQSSSHD
jgi:hypothetical protein